MLRSKGIKQSYYDEIKQVLNLNCCYPLITHNISYIKWLVYILLCMPVEHALESSYLADPL